MQLHVLLAMLSGLGPGVLSGPPAPIVYSGRSGQTAVKPPRMDGPSKVDGVLDEAQWKSAAVLTGFSQYSPVDGLPAADSTEVLVWYSATALHIGVRAFDATGSVRATLAARDQIFGDDNIQIYLSTFNDGRQATFFAVNPLGVQADGALSENGGVSGCGMAGCGTNTRQSPNLSPDFQWESKGQLTPSGYEVEIRIPFKSLRFQQTKTQTWGFNVVRVVQRSGQEQTWTTARRGSSSFLRQSGTLEGLTDLEAGHVLDVIPTMTSHVTGATAAANAPWDYAGGKPEVGADIRYGLTHNLTLNATAHPDFSQIDADVTQFAFDPRQAIRYPEKRPFFLEGAEQFDAPFSLIYTRRIVQPVAAGKLTGKIGGTRLGFLAAVDDPVASRYDDNPSFGVLRASRDLGVGSRLGMVWTEQHDGPETNRVLGTDGRFVFHKTESFSFGAAFAHDADGGVVKDAPIWSASFRHDGRNLRFNTNISGISPDFVTRTGFISQPGIATAGISASYTLLRQGRRLESVSFEVNPSANWKYDSLVSGGEMQNRYLHFNASGRWKGGWTTGASYFVETFGYDPAIYKNYFVRQTDGTVVPFTGGNARLPNKDYVVSLNTPRFKHWDFNTFVLLGLNDENYFEWASGRVLTLRPSDQLRFNLTVNQTQVNRPSDGSLVSNQVVPVFTAVFQRSRALQIRVISQYAYNKQGTLRDDSRTNLPIVTRNGDGTYSPAAPFTTGRLQANVLLTYLPNPGTVAYLGYGTVAQRPNLDGVDGLGAVQRTFFLKLSYLWRRQG